MKHRYISLICFLLAIGLFWQCRKEVELDDNDQNFPLQLNVQVDGSQVNLDWEAKRTTGFQSWVLRRSNVSIPVGIEPTSPDQQDVIRSSDESINTVKDQIALFDTATYYRLYIRTNNRWIESNEIKITSNQYLFNGSSWTNFYHPRKPWILFLAQVNGSNVLILFDRAQQKELGRINRADLYDSNYISVNFATSNGEEKLYLGTSNNYFLDINLPSLDIVREVYLGTITWSMYALPEKNWLLASSNDYTYGVSKRDLSDPASIVTGFYSPYYYTERQISPLNESSLTFLEVGYYEMNRFRLNTDGSFDESYKRTAPPQYLAINPFKQTAFSPDRTKFIVNRYGQIFDEELNIIKTIPNSVNINIIDIRFSLDGQYLYTLENNSMGEAVISKLKYTDLSIVNTIKTPNVQGVRIYPLDNERVELTLNHPSSTQFTFTTINL
jgi:hypothetical protein